jgi:hypothetical protein
MNSISASNSAPQPQSLQPSQQPQSQGQVPGNGTQVKAIGKKIGQDFSTSKTLESNSDNNASLNTSNTQSDSDSDGNTSIVTNNSNPSSTSEQTGMISESLGGATAQGAINEQFQQAGSSQSLAGSSTISKQATDYISKSLASSSSTMTLKMQTKVLGTAQQSTLTNENFAPALPEPSNSTCEEAPQAMPSESVFSNSSNLGASSSVKGNVENTLTGKKSPTLESPSQSNSTDITQSNVVSQQSINTFNKIAPSVYAKSTAQASVSQNTSKSTTPDNTPKNISVQSNKSVPPISPKTSSSTKKTSTQEATTTESTSSEDVLGSGQSESVDALNVYEVLENAGVVTTQSQLKSVSAAVAGANAQETIQQAEIANQETQINNYVQQQEQAASQANKTSGLGNLGPILGGIMIALGAIVCVASVFDCGVTAPLGVGLMLGGAGFIALSEEGPEITNAIAESLTHIFSAFGIQLSPLVSQILATIVEMVALVAITVMSGGALAGADAAAAAGTAVEAGTAAADTADAGTAAADTADAGTTTADAADTTTVTNVGSNETEATITASSLKSGLSGMSKFLEETFPSLAKKTATTATKETELTSLSATSTEAGTTTSTEMEKASSAITTLASTLKSVMPNALSAIMVGSALVQVALSVFEAVNNYKVAQFQQGARDALAAANMDTAVINQMQDFIDLTNTFNQTMLKDASNVINEYGSTLSGFSSANPLDNLTGSRA